MIAEVEGLGLSGVCGGFLGAEAAEVEGLSSRRKGSLELLASLIRRGTNPTKAKVNNSYIESSKNVILQSTTLRTTSKSTKKAKFI